MAVNFDAILKIGAQVTGMGAVSQLGGEINKVAEATRKGFKATIDSASWQAGAAAAAGIGVALVTSTKAAIDFETSVSRVRKVMDGLETPKAIREISTEIIGLSKELPVSAKGFAEIYAAAGASGIARSEVKAFAKDVAGLSVAFEMTADQAGTSIAKLRNSLGMSQPEVMKLADAMNYLDQQTAARASQLVEFALRSGAVGQQAGLTAEKTVAFGAAMISAGADTDVAATSFNNMMKALMRGDSMTDRQVAALQTLGLAAGKAATAISTAQDEMARSAEDRRYENALSRRKDGAIRIAEMETNGVLREAQRRMDEQLKILDRQVSQEERTLNKKYRTIETAERRQTEDLLEQLRRRVTGTDQASQDYLKREQRAIEDASQARMDAINERKDQELQVIKDRRDQAKKAYEEDVAAFKEAEQERLDNKRKQLELSFAEERALYDGQQKILKIQQDDAARLSGQSAGLKLAKAMQDNAEPTIRDFIGRIKALPKEMQTSVISDFFGDEARALPALIQNIDNLGKALGFVSDEGNYAGSMSKELAVQMGTTAAQMRLARNNVESLQIEIGNQLLPVIKDLIPGFIAVVQAISGFAEANPLLTKIAIGVGAIGAAVIIALPVVAGLGMALQIIAGFGLGATLAGWAGAIVPVATGLAGLVAGFVTAPVLIGAALVAAGIAVFTFRDQIGAAFAGLFDKIANPTTGFIAIIGLSWNSAMDSLKNYGSNILSNVTENWTAFFDTIIGPENGLIARLGQTWNQAMDGMRDYALSLVRPVTDAWESIIGTVRGVINGALSLAGRAVNSFIDQINRLIAAANSVSAAVRGPQLGLIQPVQVPQFAVGGRVDRPTLIMAGEEGSEYIVPQRKVPQFIQAQMGDEGLGIRQGSSARGSATGGTFAPVIKLQTGPVQQQPDGSQWIRLEDAQAVAADAVGQLWDHLQSYDGRQALGVA